jgi:hypothetical protein
MFWNGITASDGLSGVRPKSACGRRCIRGNSSHRPRESVAAPGHGLDNAACRSFLVEDPAQRGDLHILVVVLDRGFRPDRFHDLGPGGEFSRQFDQNAEDGECARAHDQRREGPALVAAREDTSASVKAKTLEQEEPDRAR